MPLGASSVPNGRPTVLIANPSSDVYGSDLQMVETVRAAVAAGWQVDVLTPGDGPLVSRLQTAGATVEFTQFPVLRRSFASPLGLIRLAATALKSAITLRRIIVRRSPSVVYVNTVTLPWWLLASRLARVPSICHVHEAETADRRLVRRALTMPLALADSIVLNGTPAREAALDVVPRLHRTMRVIENGVAGPPIPVNDPPPSGPTRLVVIGRLSPRKATHVALEAVARLRTSGRDVVLELCGDAFPGYEWYVTSLHERASQPDLVGAVTFSGYVADVWQALERSHVLVAPSLGESLGNAVIQGLLAGRPVVATDVQGHREAIVHDVTGLLVPAEDPEAMAAAVARLLDDPDRAAQLAETGQQMAVDRFATARYDAEIVDELCIRSTASTGRTPAQGAN